MRRRGGAVAFLAAAGLAAAPATAGEPTAWQRTTLVDLVNVAATGPGEAMVVHHTDDVMLATTYGPRGEHTSSQQLDAGWVVSSELDGSAAGGAVVAWENEDFDEVRIVERPPGQAYFRPVARVHNGVMDYGYGQPLVDVNERGDALVAFLVPAEDGMHEIVALHRPAGGRFGDPERVAGPAPALTLIPRDVALAPDGTAAVGFALDRVAHVTVRPPAGRFGDAEALGGRAPEHSYRSPRVGFDGAGDAVAAWIEDAEANVVGPVRMAFRRAGEPSFGSPVETGIDATMHGAIDLGVSAIGEVILAVEANEDNPDRRSTHIEGVRVVTGNAATGRISAPVTLGSIWERTPRLSMNERGDAVLAYDECCPLAVRVRRRAPLGGFGPEEDLQAPVPVPDGDEGRGGIVIRDAAIDTLGNALASFEDFELEETTFARALPATTEPAAEVPPLGDRVPPVLAPPPVPVPGPETEPEVPDGAGDPFGPSPSAGFGAPSPPLLPSAPGGSHPPDRVAPRLRITVRRATVRRIDLRVRCSEACAIRLAGTFRGRRLGPAEAGVRHRGGSARLAIALPRRARGGVARLRAVATDAAGNTTPRTTRVRVRARRP